jgi:hypothetical protein
LHYWFFSFSIGGSDRGAHTKLPGEQQLALPVFN